MLSGPTKTTPSFRAPSPPKKRITISTSGKKFHRDSPRPSSPPPCLPGCSSLYTQASWHLGIRVTPNKVGYPSPAHQQCEEHKGLMGRDHATGSIPLNFELAGTYETKHHSPLLYVLLFSSPSWKNLHTEKIKANRATQPNRPAICRLFKAMSLRR